MKHVGKGKINHKLIEQKRKRHAGRTAKPKGRSRHGALKSGQTYKARGGKGGKQMFKQVNIASAGAVDSDDSDSDDGKPAKKSKKGYSRGGGGRGHSNAWFFVKMASFPLTVLAPSTLFANPASAGPGAGPAFPTVISAIYVGHDHGIEGPVAFLAERFHNIAAGQKRHSDSD